MWSKSNVHNEFEHISTEVHCTGNFAIWEHSFNQWTRISYSIVTKPRGNLFQTPSNFTYNPASILIDQCMVVCKSVLLNEDCWSWLEYWSCLICISTTLELALSFFLKKPAILFFQWSLMIFALAVALASLYSNVTKFKIGVAKLTRLSITWHSTYSIWERCRGELGIPKICLFIFMHSIKHNQNDKKRQWKP